MAEFGDGFAVGHFQICYIETLIALHLLVMGAMHSGQIIRLDVNFNSVRAR